MRTVWMRLEKSTAGLSQTVACPLRDSETEHRERSAALTHQHGIAARAHRSEVDHGGRFRGAGARVDYGADLLLEAVADLRGVVQGLGFAGRNERGRQQRLAVQ